MGLTQMDQSYHNYNKKHHTESISVFSLADNKKVEDTAQDVEENGELTLFQNQVAGHLNSDKHFGIIKFKEALLKPIPNPVYFNREASFYEHLQSIGVDECEPDVLIKKLVPKFFGRSVVQINGSCVQCLVMEDLTRGMREPCIMDVKIGRRTWDPEATLEKINGEDAKYLESKREYGFCIPGFQVYDVKTGAMQKFGRVYGKQLNKDTIVESMRFFLNGVGKPMRRILVVQLLVDLWHIQRWARKQRRHRLYSSSILLIYDARRLRQFFDASSKPPTGTTPPETESACGLRRTNSLYRPLSLAILDDKCTKTGFSGQLTKEGPIFPCRATKFNSSLPAQAVEAGRRRPAASLKRMHSFHNNYDEELRSIRTDYANILEDLVDDCHSEVWAAARMIDFSHTFPADSITRPDVNYLDGIESLVKMMEDFLAESEE